MFKEDVLSGLSWLPLISGIVLAKNPRDPRDVVPLSFPTMFGLLGLVLKQHALVRAIILERRRSNPALYLNRQLTKGLESLVPEKIHSHEGFSVS